MACDQNIKDQARVKRAMDNLMFQEIANTNLRDAAEKLKHIDQILSKANSVK